MKVDVEHPMSSASNAWSVANRVQGGEDLFDSPHLKSLATIKGMVHATDAHRIWMSRGNGLYQAEIPTGCDQLSNFHFDWRELGCFPLSFFKTLLGIHPLSRRLCRLDLKHVLPLHNGNLVIQSHRRIHVWSQYEQQFLNGSHRVQGSNPLALCQDASQNVYYGEYLNNPDRQPVRVWQSANGGEDWQPIYTFHSIRHIHGIYADPYTNALWITTGDSDSESCLWQTSDQFKTVHKVVGGHQHCRAIPLLFTADFIYFGSDTPLEQNYLFRMHRKTLHIEKLIPVGGSVFHATQCGPWLLFSTAVEPSEVNKSRQAELWGSRDGETWHPLWQAQKDRWPMKWFQYGQIRLHAMGEGRLWITPFSTQGHGYSHWVEID